MKATPATRSQFFLIQLVFFISSFNVTVRFKVASFCGWQVCYFPEAGLFCRPVSARLSGSGLLSLLGTWKMGLLLIRCHPRCMSPTRGTITITTL